MADGKKQGNKFFEGAKRLLGALGEILFPSDICCIVCGEDIDEGYFCKNCLESLPKNDGVVCVKCGKSSPSPGPCSICRRKQPRFGRAFSPLVYEDSVTQLIGRFKNSAPELALPLAHLMASKVDRDNYDAICYIPMTEQALEMRGFNQSYLLAKELSKIFSLPILEDALVKVRETIEQKNLVESERENNLHGCFAASDCVKGLKILLVDDVMTTGTTGDEACNTLLAAGAKRADFLTVASTTILR